MVSMYQAQLESLTATPERLTHPPPSIPGTLPGSLVGKFNEVSSKPSASKPSATPPVTGIAVVTSIGLPKTVASGVIVAGELMRL